MRSHRVVGIETEYGIISPGNPHANPVQLSAQLLAAYRTHFPVAAGRWDYSGEDPLADARGFHLERASAHPSLLTDNPQLPAPSGDSRDAGCSGPDQTYDERSALADLAGVFSETARPERTAYENPGMASAILSNGARLYVDHAHPEYSAPEAISPREVALWDKAGERIMADAAVAASKGSGPQLVCYKNNTDGKGASYGTHENYLVLRDVPFNDLIAYLTPFLVTRQIFTGSGRVGLGSRGEDWGFQMSQRADFVEAEVGLETTLRRPIINTRDEPHADASRFRRLHVIVGDATMMDVATYIRVGTMNLVLAAMERGVRHPELRLADPVAAFHQVSRDLSLRKPLIMADGGEMTAIEIQRAYLADALSGGPSEDVEEADLVSRWETILDQLEREPSEAAGSVEWLAKHRVLEALRSRGNLTWGDPRIAAADLQWSDIRPERSLYARVAARGMVEVLFDEREVTLATVMPPESTRAWLRGRAVGRFGAQIAGANWESIVFDVPGRQSLQRVTMPDPIWGNKESVGAITESVGSIEELLSRLETR